jgi:hypothetical protein
MGRIRKVAEPRRERGGSRLPGPMGSFLTAAVIGRLSRPGGRNIVAQRRTLVRGGITLALLAALAGAMVVAPAGAHVTGKFAHLKKHMRQVAKKVFNQKIGSASVANADQLDNIDSAGFLQTTDIRVDGAASDTYIPNFSSAAFTPILSKSFTAPSNGFLFIVGSVSWESSLDPASMRYRLRLDSTPVTSDPFAYMADVEGTENQVAGSASAVVPVTAGNHTVHLDANMFAGQAFIIGRDLSILFAESGSGVTIPVRSPGRTTGSEIPSQS